MPRFQVDTKLFYAKLNEFRSQGTYCDVNVEIEERSFRCHRVVLAAACEYFNSMFNGNFMESSSDNVILRAEITPTAFELILQCMYTGEVEISAANAYDLLRAGDYLELPYIEEACVLFVLRNLSKIRNMLDIFTFACATGKESLIKPLSKYIMENLGKFARNDSKFVEIPFANLRLILDQNAPSRIEEDVLTHAVVQWVQHSPEERASHVADFAKIIRFQDVSPEYTKFFFTRFISDCRSVTELPSFDVLKKKLSLHVYVEYLPKVEGGSVTKIFSRSGDAGKWYSKSSYGIYPGSYFLRNIALDDYQYLYCLDYRQNGTQTFRMCSSSISQYTTSSNLLASPPVLLSKFDMCGLNNCIYVYNTSHQEVDYLTNSQNEEAANHRHYQSNGGIYGYDRQTDKWFQASGTLAVRRATLTSDQENGILYLIGGGLSGCSTQMMDPRQSRWEYLPTTHFRYMGAASCTHEGKIYVSGGDRDSKRVEIFDRVAGRWTIMEPMNRGRLNHRLLFFMNRLYAIGNSYTDYNIEVYDPLFGQWCLLSLPKETIERANPDRKRFVPSFIQDAIVYKPFNDTN